MPKRELPTLAEFGLVLRAIGTVMHREAVKMNDKAPRVPSMEAGLELFLSDVYALDFIEQMKLDGVDGKRAREIIAMAYEEE